MIVNEIQEALKPILYSLRQENTVPPHELPSRNLGITRLAEIVDFPSFYGVQALSTSSR